MLSDRVGVSEFESTQRTKTTRRDDQRDDGGEDGLIAGPPSSQDS